MTQGYAPVNGLQMYYEVHGTGRPLVLLHGGLMTIELSFGVVRPELAADRQVIATELQGHGRTADIDQHQGILAGARAVISLGHDDFIRLEHAVEMHALIPGAQLAVLPGATHMGVMRRTDLIVPLVRDFLG